VDSKVAFKCRCGRLRFVEVPVEDDAPIICVCGHVLDPATDMVDDRNAQHRRRMEKLSEGQKARRNRLLAVSAGVLLLAGGVALGIYLSERHGAEARGEGQTSSSAQTVAGDGPILADLRNRVRYGDPRAIAQVAERVATTMERMAEAQTAMLEAQARAIEYEEGMYLGEGRPDPKGQLRVGDYATLNAPQWQPGHDVVSLWSTPEDLARGGAAPAHELPEGTRVKVLERRETGATSGGVYLVRTEVGQVGWCGPGDLSASE
jgi:hypothetical protein